jgi:hypothetical protein
MVAGVLMGREGELAQVVSTVQPVGELVDAQERGQEQGQQDDDDGENHQ